MRDSPAVARVQSLLREMFTIDLRTLALFRIAVGSILVADLLLRARFFSAMYTEGGAPLPAQPPGALLSLHGVSLDSGFQAALFLVAGALAGMLLVGYRTRLATIGSWVLLISLQDAWPDFGDGGDALLRVLLLWSIFLPLGARFSIDARSSKRPASAPVCSVASAALLLQFAFVYFFTGIGKSGPEWQSGLALELTLANEYWTLPAGRLLHEYLAFLRFLTPVVRWFEMLGPLVMLLTFRSGILRLLTMASFWFFQLGLAVTIHLHLFPVISTASTLPFLPLWFWNVVERRRQRGSETAAPAAPQPWLSRAWQVGVAGLLVFVFASNLESRSIIPLPLSDGVAAFASKLGVDQSWDMYVPRPPIDNFSLDHEFVPVAGRTLDESDPGRERRRMIEHFEGNYRFKYYLERTLNHPRRPERVERYLTWMCREWNAGLPAERRLERVALSVDTRTTLAGGRPPRHILLLDHTCEAADS